MENISDEGWKQIGHIFSALCMTIVIVAMWYFMTKDDK